MSESTLQTTFSEIYTELGRYLGYDRTESNWSADQQADATEIIKRGLRQFYFPYRTNPQEQAHRWSFLRPQSVLWIWDDVIAADAITVSSAVYASPVTTITASAAVFYPSMEEKSMTFTTGTGSYVIDEYVSSTVVKVTGNASAEAGKTLLISSGDTFTLPWDYGGMAGDGRFTFDVDENQLYVIEICSNVKIRRLRQSSVSTGYPYLAAIIPLTTNYTQGQRWAVMFHQPPNDVFELHYRYYIQPDKLVVTTLEYPYGSVAHSETILESCLAIAESREKDTPITEHRDKFSLLLQASIDHDRQYGETVTEYGYNGDHSDGPDDRYIPYRHNSLITFNGS